MEAIPARGRRRLDAPFAAGAIAPGARARYVVRCGRSVDDEDAGTDGGARSMRCFTIGDLVAHSGP